MLTCKDMYMMLRRISNTPVWYRRIADRRVAVFGLRGAESIELDLQKLLEECNKLKGEGNGRS